MNRWRGMSIWGLGERTESMKKGNGTNECEGRRWEGKDDGKHHVRHWYAGTAIIHERKTKKEKEEEI